MVWVACLVFLFTSWQDSKAQTAETTGNIVINTPQGGPSSWVNGVYQDNLTCWAGGQPGYCGPNPIVRPGNNINFSYGLTDLYQVRSVASVLPNSGTGLVVSGYNFRFTAKNGNGWDDGRVDQLTAYVHLKDTTGKVLEYDSYNLNYKFNWTSFNYSKDFTNPYAASTLGNVTYGFLGRDNNFWAGPYGPEINTISFELKYRVDPCSTNPTYSPSCPGYGEAMSKLVPQQTTPTVATTSEPISTVQEPVPTAQPVQTQAAPQTVAQTSSTVQQTTSAPATQQTTQQTSSSSPNLQLALNLITRNQERDRQQQQQAVQLALDVTQQAVDKTLSVAQQTAQQAVQQSQATEIVVSTTVSIQQQSLQQTFALQQQQTTQQLQRNQTASVTTEQQPAQFSSLAQQQQIGGNTQVAQQVNTAQQSSLQLQQPQQPLSLTTARVTEQTTQPVAAITVPSPVAQQYQLVQAPLVRPQQPEIIQVTPTVAEPTKPVLVTSQTIYREQELPQQNIQTLLDRSNPLGELMLGQTNQQSATTQQPISELRRTGQTNELAGGITLDTMATQPQGYNQYLALALQDARFYSTREIYGKQTTVDNQRALRQLSSDRLHQQMVNQQYK